MPLIASRAFSARPLDEANGRVGKDDRQDDNGVDAVSEPRGGDSGNLQDVDEEVMELRKKSGKGLRGFAGGSWFAP